MNSKKDFLALGAGILGGIAGCWLFLWIARQGFYALVLPGAMVGIAAGWFRSKSTAVGVICGVLALAAGLLAEWLFAPFAKDHSLGYFLAHADQLQPITLIMLGVGTIIGCGLPLRNRRSDLE